jgi:hypothetical protein
MKKLKLDVEMLAVDSFGTGTEEGGVRGTVQGQPASPVYMTDYCVTLYGPPCTLPVVF